MNKNVDVYVNDNVRYFVVMNECMLRECASGRKHLRNLVFKYISRLFKCMQL